MNIHFDHRIKLDGVNGFVTHITNNGQQITICGWDNYHHRYNRGDLLLLVQKDGSETRYQIDTVDHCRDPADQYFITCTFAPRSNKK